MKTFEVFLFFFRIRGGGARPYLVKKRLKMVGRRAGAVHGEVEGDMMQI